MFTKTNAADKGQDVTAMHVSKDSLMGTQRRRVNVQCRHQKAGISVADIATVKEQMKLWAAAC
jgi:hypothetical protein